MALAGCHVLNPLSHDPLQRAGNGQPWQGRPVQRLERAGRWLPSRSLAATRPLDRLAWRWISACACSRGDVGAGDALSSRTMVSPTRRNSTSCPAPCGVPFGSPLCFPSVVPLAEPSVEPYEAPCGVLYGVPYGEPCGVPCGFSDGFTTARSQLRTPLALGGGAGSPSNSSSSGERCSAIEYRSVRA